jgi:small subunit ribosomal protein S1
VGDVVEGTITGITDFGAFLSFGSDLEGLIHISELDWKIVKNPAEVVKVGQKVSAKIIDISNGRISLSLKALQKNPELENEKK